MKRAAVLISTVIAAAAAAAAAAASGVAADPAAAATVECTLTKAFLVAPAPDEGGAGHSGAWVKLPAGAKIASEQVLDQATGKAPGPNAFPDEPWNSVFPTPPYTGLPAPFSGAPSEDVMVIIDVDGSPGASSHLPNGTYDDWLLALHLTGSGAECPSGTHPGWTVTAASSAPVATTTTSSATETGGTAIPATVERTRTIDLPAGVRIAVSTDASGKVLSISFVAPGQRYYHSVAGHREPKPLTFVSVRPGNAVQSITSTNLSCTTSGGAGRCTGTPSTATRIHITWTTPSKETVARILEQLPK